LNKVAYQTKNPASRPFRTGAICVDFDGVIAEFSEDIQEFGPPISGAAEAMAELKSLGFKVIIHTARPANDDHIRALKDYLDRHGIAFDEMNTNSDCHWKAVKPLADFYIDDRAIRFEGDWNETLSQVKMHLGLVTNVYAAPSHAHLLDYVVERAEEVLRFEKFLATNTSWLTAPASTRYHLAEEGGLVQHSLNVARTLLTLRRMLAPDLSAESCVIVALYHDVGKVGTPGRLLYLPNPDQWQVKNRGIKYIINPDLSHMDLASRSLMLVSRHISLTDEEAQAIRYHDGQYIESNRTVAHRECRLTRLLQYADNWSGGVIEGDGNSRFPGLT
jgi:hypothetical protein